MRTAALVAFALGAAHAGPARAQDSAAARDTTAVRRVAIDAMALRPTQLLYQMLLERDNGSTILGTRTIDVSRTTYVGTPAWLLVETRSVTGVPAVDSLYADGADLHALHWSAAQGDAHLVMEFRGDTAYGGTSAPPGRHSSIASVPAGTLVNGAMLENVLRLLPLQPTFEDSTTTLSVTLGDLTVLPTRIAVIGEDHVRVAAGTFDCWVVSVHAGDTARGLYWVTKRDPIVVRSALDVPMLGGAQLVTELTRIAR
ncbi:MAG TPA: hypothetical protein VHB25_11250 [Gemmatimonadaceae bacterium]|nr:hypothetical protein [Gemmatimonadaceae bacterium]